MKNTSLSFMFAVDSAPMCEATQFLITGGTGFIGRYVVWRLVARDARVRLLCRTPQKAQRLFGDRVNIVGGDLRDRSSVAAAMEGVGVVIHLGAMYQFGRESRQVVEQTNVCGTKHMLEAAARNEVERFVHVSSCGVLDGTGKLLTEKDFPDHVPVQESYRRSKWLSELAALEAAKTGLPVTIASPTSPLGSGDEAPTPTGQIVRDYLGGQFPFTARVGLNLVHIDDLADGILAVLDRGRIGERYLLGHHNVWLHEFLQLLAEATDCPAPRFILPQRAIIMAGAVGEAMGSTRICRETAAHAGRRQWFEFSKATEELGWRAQIPLTDIANEAVKWFERRRVAA
jgi:dihydroflavonol-4-reductase